MKRNSMNEPVNCRIVLVGKTGSGKSSAGNTILGQECFEIDVSPVSVTRTCKRGEEVIDKQIISVIDTPGLFDTTMLEDEMKNEIARCVDMSLPGPHAFLLVIRLGVRFTDEEKNAVKWIQENFGEKAVQYAIVLFTHADALEGKPLDEYISKSKDLQALVNECSGRFHSFNNKNTINRIQVTELLKKIGEMIKRNSGEHYTNDMYKQAQARVKREAMKQNLKDCGKTALTVVMSLGGEAVAKKVVAAFAEKAVAAAAEGVATAAETAATAVTEAATTAAGAVVASATEAAATAAGAVVASAMEAAAKEAVEVVATATEGVATAVVGAGAVTTVNIATEATTAVVLTGRAAILSAVGGAAVVVARGVGKGVVTAARLAGGPAARAVTVAYGGAAALAAKFRP